MHTNKSSPSDSISSTLSQYSNQQDGSRRPPLPPNKRKRLSDDGFNVDSRPAILSKSANSGFKSNIDYKTSPSSSKVMSFISPGGSVPPKTVGPLQMIRPPLTVRTASPNSISIASALSLLSGMPFWPQASSSTPRGTSSKETSTPVLSQDTTSEEEESNSTESPNSFDYEDDCHKDKESTKFESVADDFENNVSDRETLDSMDSTDYHIAVREPVYANIIA
jgi:hypothetical protein